MLERIFFTMLVLALIVIIIAIGVMCKKEKNHIPRKRCKQTFWPITFSFCNIKIKGGITMVSLKKNQAVYGTLGKPVDKNGDPAEIEAGSLKITSANPGVVTVEPDENAPDDHYRFKLVSQGIGAAQVDIIADADLGEGVTEISTFVGVEVTGGTAVGFAEPTFGAPVDL